MINELRKRATSVSGIYDVEPVYVQSHLAVTPSEMMELSQSGVPISSQVDDSLFYDGDNSFKVDIDPVLMRGVDINDAWNAQQDAAKKLHQAQVKDIKTYGK